MKYAVISRFTAYFTEEKGDTSMDRGSYLAAATDSDPQTLPICGAQARSAEELVALGDQHFTAYTDEEVGVLFQHLRELSMFHADYDESEWRELQAQLCHRNILIDIFPEDFKGYPWISDMLLSLLFHRLWTRHREGYNKMSWKVFQKQLIIRKLFI